MNIVEIDYCFPKAELFNLLTKAIEIGKQLGQQELGEKSKYISAREAGRLFTVSRVRNWINDGAIKVKSNGMGRNSKKYLELSKLMALDASEIIKIRKTYRK